MANLNLQGKGWANLSLEVRFMIWELVYSTRAGRIVEVRTQKHAHNSYKHKYCPRYSPSPPPTVVNICHEARGFIQSLARRAGHLIFQTKGKGADMIYFDHKIDTLFLHNEKEYWIRDWGPEGILTQFQYQHTPEQLRFLAIDMEPSTRAATKSTLMKDLKHFPRIKTIIFVIHKGNTEARKVVKELDEDLKLLQWFRSGRPRVSIASPRPSQCRLAIRTGEAFVYQCL